MLDDWWEDVIGSGKELTSPPFDAKPLRESIRLLSRLHCASSSSTPP